jgi:CRISPR-associated protein Csx17
MSITIHHLYGCTPTPLANYLKALGILRLVSEQADPAARGAWRDEHFVLATTLTEPELETFFLERYAPTPFVAPWNKGAGFLTKDRFLAAMEASPLLRLRPFQDGIRAARALCSELEYADAAIRIIKDEPKQLPTKDRAAYKDSDDYKSRLSKAEKTFKRLKDAFIQECRLKWRGTHEDWMDAAIILRSDGSPAFPALLGTGGGDGRLDFTNNFMQRFQDLVDVTRPDAPVASETESLLRDALYGTSQRGTSDCSIGQFSPGSAGGANSTNGLDGKGNVNPWNFIMVFEGAMLFSASSSRRFSTTRLSTVSAPFAVHAAAAGTASASVSEDSTRGEQWMPLWSQFSCLKEIQRVLAEGRAQIDRSAAKQPLDLARAIARLGVSRGICGFERFGYLVRNGLSNFAVPLGRWKVATQPNQELLADIDAWLNRFQKAAREKGAPNRLAMLNKRLTDAVMAVTSQGSDPLRWQDILLALAEIEGCMAAGAGLSAGILSSLRPGWLTAADDRSPEIRLALSIAAQYGVRNHWLPLDKYGKRLVTTDEGKRLANDPRVVCFGRDFVSDALALVNRRIVEASQDGGGNLIMTPVHGALTADLRDIASFLQGGLNHGKIMRLARAFMMLDLSALRDAPLCLQPPALSGVPVDDAFTMIRFCLLPKHCVTGKEWKIPLKAEVYRRLNSGDLPTAMRLAFQHLRAHGFTPPLQIAAGDPRLLSASMAFSISCSSRDELLQSFITTPTKQGE